MKIILLRGIAASGKSTLAKKISEKIDAPVLSKDTIFDTCLANGTDWGMGNKISYDFVYSFIDKNKNNDSVLILDVGLHKNEYAQKLIDFCEDNRVLTKSIVTTCSDESEWRRRFDERKKSPLPNQKITDFDEMSEHCGGMSIDLLDGELLYDSSLDEKNQLQRVYKYIENQII